MIVRIILNFILIVAIGGCASIPPEAPELSTRLGVQLSSLEKAHMKLLEEFFSEKRRRVDEFIQKEWVPLFASEFFSTPNVAKVWDEVVLSDDPAERLRFITIAGPKLQEKINSKRVELIKPLDELELVVKGKLKAEYDQARSINNTLTSFLLSASKVEENRKRYLDMVGVSDEQIDKYISDTDEAVSELVGAAGTVEKRLSDIEEYRVKIKQILDRINKG